LETLTGSKNDRKANFDSFSSQIGQNEDDKKEMRKTEKEVQEQFL